MIQLPFLITHRFIKGHFIKSIENLLHSFFPEKMVSFNILGDPENVPDEVKMTVYKVIYKQAGNILKQAKAKHIKFCIYSNRDQISVLLEHDGVGPRLPEAQNGRGLTSIHKRIRAVGGTVEVSNHTGKGSSMKIVLPGKAPFNKVRFLANNGIFDIAPVHKTIEHHPALSLIKTFKSFKRLALNFIS